MIRNTGSADCARGVGHTGLTELGRDELEDALERIIAGPEKKNSLISPDKKRLVSFHEA
jgi:ATP-dependent Zn protease